MAGIGMPKISIVFKGLGVSAFKRGNKGYAVLIIKDEGEKGLRIARYKSLEDLTEIESKKYTTENLLYIKDVLEGTPKELIVARMGSKDVLADLLKELKGQMPMNCRIAIAGATSTETNDLISWVKSCNKNENKRFKVLAYKAQISDFQHVENLTNDEVTFKDERKKQLGEKAIPWMLGYLAGLELDISAIAKPLQKFESVKEPDSIEEAINRGELVLINDEAEVFVARAVNSLVTTGQGVTDDFKYILNTEVMDLMYTDIYTTWKKFYKGKYKNFLDNQMLLVSAINAYFEELENNLLLDPKFKNECKIDIGQQRLANIPKYGDEVYKWNDDKVLEMTVGTDVYLYANVKILNATEDLKMIIYV